MIDLIAPWYTYYNKLTAMFSGDPQVLVKPLSDDDHGNCSVDIIVNNGLKTWALKKILVNTVSYGGVTFNINVIYIGKDTVSSFEKTYSIGQVYEYALSGNNAFIKVESHADMYFCILKKSVVQFYNDDLLDYYRNWNGLFRDIAKEIFDINKYPVYFSTDRESGALSH